MKKAVVLLCLYACLGMSTAFAAPKVKWTTDSFSGTKTAKLDLMVFGPPGISGPIVSIDLYGVAPAKHYFIRVEYKGLDWLFIPAGETLYLKTDGQMFPLSGDGNANSRKTYDTDPYGYRKDPHAIHVDEVALYEITAEQIRKLAASGQIQYRLVGQNQTLTSGVHKNPEFKVFLDQALPVIEAEGGTGSTQSK